ncbi:MAG: DUF1688 family protein [Deltaproteobacteria bacterium]|nr:DUF1688 family protein [Deltaproteobacteria bacterium]
MHHGRIGHDSTRPSMQDAQSPIAFLRSPHAVRQRAESVLTAGLEGSLAHFRVQLDAMPRVIDRVARITRQRYPDLRVPWPSRLDRLRLGGHDRLAAIRAALAGDPDERARVLFEIAIISILLGAGAGPRWRYHERATGIALGRTEGLALASFHAYVDGLFSNDPKQPLRADADALDALDPLRFARALDVRADNPMEGLAGRTELLSQLGSAMRAASHFFGEDAPRLGRLFDAMKARASRTERGRAIPARRMLSMILEAFSPIWPSRHTVMGVSVGDVWPHPRAGGAGPSAGLVPFHTFSQWMTYSLISVLEEAGVFVDDVAELPGMTEYRTCGLFVDDGVLVPVSADLRSIVHDVGSEPIVEWRALSLALLTRVGRGLRETLGVEGEVMPAACVIEGGTWAAGREAAREHRSDGTPPILARTDGTVF